MRDREDDPVPDHRGADGDFPGHGSGAGGCESVVQCGQRSGRWAVRTVDRIGSHHALKPVPAQRRGGVPA